MLPPDERKPSGLQGRREDLLSSDVARLGSGHHGLHPAGRPAVQHSQRLRE